MKDGYHFGQKRFFKGIARGESNFSCKADDHFTREITCPGPDEFHHALLSVCAIIRCNILSRWREIRHGIGRFNRKAIQRFLCCFMIP